MSHVSCGAGRIRDDAHDLTAVRSACEALGLEFHAGVTAYKWYGRWVNDYSRADAAYKNGIAPEDYGKCSHMIRVKGAPDGSYEAGLFKMPDGAFAVVFDHWSSGKGAKELAARLGWDGSDCKALMQRTSQFKVVAAAARQKGHTVKRVEELPGGKLRVVIGVRQPDAEGDLR